MSLMVIRAAAVIAITAGATLDVSTALASGDAAHDWPRFGFDAAGSNASTAPAGIATADLAKLKLQRIQLPGTVDASAIYLHAVPVRGAAHDVFFVTTTYGITLAIDADSGTILWQHQPDGYDKWVRTRQLTTATPVADPDRTFIYAANPGGEIEKLAVADGRPAWSIGITRNPQREKIASALNFFGGRVIAVTGGYIGDAPPYQGHVVLIDAASGHLVSAWNSLCSDRAGLIDPSTCARSGSAIWGRTGAVIDTATGSIFVATGNGRWDGLTNWGDAVIELDRGATRMLGSYTPTTTAELESADLDLGSTSPVLLGDYVVQSGKDGIIRLLEWKKMRAGIAHRGGETQSVKTASGKGLFTAPAMWRNGAATWIFAADFAGTEALTFANGRLEQKWKDDQAGSSPVIAGGLLYVYDAESHLRVYDPSTGAVLAMLDCGQGHWNSPIVVDGRIALPEGSSNSRVASGTMVIWRLR